MILSIFTLVFDLRGGVQEHLGFTLCDDVQEQLGLGEGFGVVDSV